MANANYQVYGPIADAAAQKHGVPTSIFKSLINSESSFDPYAYNASGAAGIAQFMPTTAKSLNIDPFNPNQALDASAKYLADNYKKYGNWQDAISQYKGYGNNLSEGYGKAASVLDDAMKSFGGSAVDQIPGNDMGDVKAAAEKVANKKANPTGSIFTWNADDWKTFLANSAYGFMIGLVGVVFILGSVWVLINRGKIETAVNLVKGAAK